MTVPFEDDKIYHLYNRGNNYENIFLEERNYILFLDLLKTYIVEIADIYAYCLLPNHFHLVLKIKSNKDLPMVYRNGQKKLHQAFSNMFNAYTKSINKAYNRRGSLFQKHLKRVDVQSKVYLYHLIFYVHLNPIKHHISEDYKSYKYTSYHSMISCKDTLLKRTEVLDLFGGRDNFIETHQQRKCRLDMIKDIERIDTDSYEK